MAVLVLVSSMLRKRLFQGITMALFGLAIFNLASGASACPSCWPAPGTSSGPTGLQQALKRAEALRRPAQAQRPQPANGPRPAPEQALHAAHLSTRRPEDHS